MYGLPEPKKVEFLKGKVLLQVCFGQNEIVLGIDEDIRLTIESKFTHSFNNERELVIKEFNEYIKHSDRVVALIGRTITKATGHEDGTLCLVFDDDYFFTIYDDSEHYESYTIKYGNVLIVV